MMKKTCNNPELLCRCINWGDEDFDVEIDHLIHNFEFLRFDLEYDALELGKSVQFCELGRCRICGGQICVGSTWSAVKSIDDLMIMIYYRADQRIGSGPLPTGINSHQEIFPLLFHEADREFARSWLEQHETKATLQAQQSDGEAR